MIRVVVFAAVVSAVGAGVALGVRDCPDPDPPISLQQTLPLEINGVPMGDCDVTLVDGVVELADCSTGEEP